MTLEQDGNIWQGRAEAIHKIILFSNYIVAESEEALFDIFT